MKSVSRVSFRRSSVSRMRPIDQSSSAMASPRGPIPVLPTKRACGTRGTCISCVAKYRKNGRARFCSRNCTALPVIVSAMSSSTQRADLPPVI